MTGSSARDRAAAALRDRAERLLAGARDEGDRAGARREVDALLRIAAHVAEGAAAVRAALGPAGTARGGVTVADRDRAAKEIYGLAQRRAERGLQRQLDAPPKPGWELGGAGLPIHRATLREAAELYELALALRYDDYWDYLRGLLHESLGDYPEAIRILEKLGGQYAEIGAQQAARCRRKLGGTYDLGAELDQEIGRLLGAAGGNAALGNVVRGAFGELRASLERARAQPYGAPDPAAAPLDDPRLERAERLAQDFAERLARGDFAAAHALLARNLRTDREEVLRDRYVRMMGVRPLADGEPRAGDPATVMVMSADRDMPNLGPRDLGWVYVSISDAKRSEAVTVIVAEEDGEARIRELEWGRP
jgi:tetratricopeptide (TPR) repeat protein